MKHSRYPIKIHYSEADKGYIAVAPDLPGCSAFGDTAEEAVREAKVAVGLWLETAKREKRKIPAPSVKTAYSGKILTRVPQSLHQTLAERAQGEGVSLNHLISCLLAKGIEGKRSSRATKAHSHK